MEFTYQRTYRGPVKAVIFDWAGTIADFGCMAPAAVFIELFRNHGVTISMAQAREPMGAPKRDHIQSIARMPEVAAAWEAAHGNRPDETLIDALYSEFIPMQVACLSQYSALIPGTLGVVQQIRERGLKIGTTTGYNAEMLAVVLREAKRQGFEAECNISASDVPAGRPAPWMALKAACDLNVYPLESIVKVGDTVPDIGEGLNGGMWTVGVVRTGNEIGLPESEIGSLSDSEYRYLWTRASSRLQQAGAHYVVDSIMEVPAVLEDIESRLRRGEKP